MFTTPPPANLQAAIDAANRSGGQLALLGRLGEAFEVYRRLYERLLGAQEELGEHRLHKGLPLANMGWARHRAQMIEDGARWTALAFIEDILSRAEESPRILDELSRPAAENLRLIGAPDAELLELVKVIRGKVAQGELVQDPYPLFVHYQLPDRIHRWLQPARTNVHIRVFVSSPREMIQERRIVAETCRQLTLTIGAHVEALLWEGGGRQNPECQPFPPEITGSNAQGVIDEHLWGRLGGYDVFVGLLWRRMGTPVNGFRSGTEAEFRFAFERRATSEDPRHVLFYARTPRRGDAIEPEVTDFLGELRGMGLVQAYSSRSEFRRAVFSHLVAVVRERIAAS